MRFLACAIALAACSGNGGALAPEDVADRGWRAHEAVIGAGERAASCLQGGPLMHLAISVHRIALADAARLDRDPDRLRRALEFIEAHPERYDDIDERIILLDERCAGDAGVQTALRELRELHVLSP